MNAPVALFAYNRLSCLEETLRALGRNKGIEQTSVYVFSDGPRAPKPGDEEKVNAVRQFLRDKKWNFSIELIEAEKNKGLANSVIDGVTKLVNEFGKVIVLEDDLVTSEYFLEYMNAALEKYEKEENVFQVSSHMFPVKNAQPQHRSFFLPMTTSWGWATWKRAWNQFDPEVTGYEKIKTDAALRRAFDLDGAYPYARMLVAQMETKKVDSWAIRWWYSVFLKKGITLFPDMPLVKNIGFDMNATHTQADPFTETKFDEQYAITQFPSTAAPDEQMFEKVKAYLRSKTAPPAQKKETAVQRIFRSIFR